MATQNSSEPVREVLPRPTITIGFYRHYKGGNYDVYGLSQRESTGEWEVLYRNAVSHLCFHRPATEFFEVVDYKGTVRFTLIGSALGKSKD